MSLSVETLAVARKYTDDSLAGAGAVAGVPCKIQSITAITGGNRVTFLWTDNNGDDHTSAMDVMNGVDGEDGKGIQSVSVNAQNHLIITYTDGTTVDAGQIEIHSSVDSVNGQTGAVVLDAEDVGALPDNTPIPSKTSDLTNDSGFATTSDVITALADYTKTADLTTLLAAKQDTLTFDDAPTENSNNPVKSNGIYAANRNIYEVMGKNGAKNLFPTNKTYNNGRSYTNNGITFVQNDDGSITVSGVATADAQYTLFTRSTDWGININVGKSYILSGCPSGGSNDTYRLVFGDTQSSAYHRLAIDIGEGTEFTITTASEQYYASSIDVRNGVDLTTPITFYPMLRPASDTDSTYQPYAKTNLQLTKDKAEQAEVNDIVNVYGAKNLIPFPYHRQSGYTTNNATFTYDDEGIITVNKVAGNATAYFGLFSNTLYPNAEIFIVPNTSYILSMELENATDTSCFVQTQNGIDLAAIRNKATGKYEISFTTPETMDFLAVSLYYGAATTENNAKVKLMIRHASIQDDTYVPYAMTNQQLTAENEALTNNINVNGSKNVLASLTPSGTYLGITISRNESGDIVVNGTATTSPTTISLFDRTFKHIGEATILKFTDLGIDKTKKYVFSRAEKVSNFRYNIRVMNGTTQVAEIELGNDDGLYTVIDFSQYTCDGLKADIVVTNGTTITNKVFSAMLCLESDYDLDTTYQPYAKTNRKLTEKIDIVGNLFTTTTKVVDNITHGIATTVATLENLPIGTYVVSGQFNSDSAMSGGGLIQFASSGVIQNGASCNPIINQGFKANAGLTGIFNVTNATNQINLQIYTATADLTVSSARLAAIRIA